MESNANGFTIIELIITIVIVGIMAVFVTSLFPGRSIDLSSQANQLAEDILFVQQLSFASQDNYKIGFVSASCYQMYNPDGTAYSHPINQLNQICLDRVSINLPSGLTSYKYLSFDQLGTPYLSTTADGTAVEMSTLADPFILTLVADASTSQTISISAVTGYTSIP